MCQAIKFKDRKGVSVDSQLAEVYVWFGVIHAFWGYAYQSVKYSDVISMWALYIFETGTSENNQTTCYLT